jgi:GT2 family glycosyltransferase
MIPHHRQDNDDILNLALESVIQSDYAGEVNIHVVSSSETYPALFTSQPKDNFKLTVHHKPELNNASKKFNWLFFETVIKTEKIALVCDDVILSKGCLSALVDATNIGSCIAGPAGNNDLNMAYRGDLDFYIDDEVCIRLNNKVKKEDAKIIARQVLDYPRISSICLVTKYRPFFCIAMNYNDLVKVGQLDEKLDVRHNDEDFCDRALKLGIANVLNLGAFALHLGGQTITKEVTDKQLKDATVWYYEKTENRKLDHSQIHGSDVKLG